AVRARLAQSVGALTLSASGETGLVRAALGEGGGSGRFAGYSFGADVAIGGRGRLSGFLDGNDGRSVMRLGPATTGAGVNGSVDLPLAASRGVCSYGAHSRSPSARRTI